MVRQSSSPPEGAQGAQQPPLGSAEWGLAGARRASVYSWFSALYAEEVSEAVYQSHFAQGAFAPFAGLEAMGLGPELERLEKAIAALRGVSLARLEMAADFAHLFLLDAKSGALPYASLYEGEEGSGMLYGAAEGRMRAFLASHALAVQAQFREPADHIAVPLAYMAHVAEKQAEGRDIPALAREQAEFLRTALFGWIERFVHRCEQVRPKFDFYPALGVLLLGFLRADLAFLDDVAGSG